MSIRKMVIAAAVLSLSVSATSAQQSPQPEVEQRVPLSDTAVALDAKNTAALEGTLRTTALNGATDMPVTNIRVVIKNISAIPYSYAAGLVTFYDGAGVRCGEGIFKSDLLAVNESVETDTPGIRIRCAAATWRLAATTLLPRIVPDPTPIKSAQVSGNLIISVDGEEHPIQLDRPMVLNVGERQRTIIVRKTP